MGGRAPSTIFWYSSARRRLTQSIIVNCVSRSRDSISGRLSQLDVVVVVVVGLCGAEVTTFVDADAALAAPRRATCSIFPARPRSRENHARTLCHDCAASLLEDPEADECGTANTASIFCGGREGVVLYKGERRGGRGDGESGTKHSQDLMAYLTGWSCGGRSRQPRLPVNFEGCAKPWPRPGSLSPSAVTLGPRGDISHPWARGTARTAPARQPPRGI